MVVNLKRLTPKRLTPKQLGDLTRQIEWHRAERRSSHIAMLRAQFAPQWRELLASNLADVFPQSTPKKLGKVAPKYRNPKDRSQTWSGRGRQPLWFAAALKSGKTERSLLIR